MHKSCILSVAIIVSRLETRDYGIPGVNCCDCCWLTTSALNHWTTTKNEPCLSIAFKLILVQCFLLLPPFASSLVLNGQPRLKLNGTVCCCCLNTHLSAVMWWTYVRTVLRLRVVAVSSPACKGCAQSLDSLSSVFPVFQCNSITRSSQVHWLRFV